MPLALECGMPSYDFWYEDIRSFKCYIKAYLNKTNNIAWRNGLYIFEAVSCALNNVLPSAINKGVTGKGSWKPLMYHEKPMELYEKTKDQNPEAEDYTLNKWVHNFRRLKGGGDIA